MRNKTTKYIQVRFNFEGFEEEHAESLAALPGVTEARIMYPDDPALYNLYLVTADEQEANEVLEAIRSYELVDFVEFVERPEPR